MSIEQVDVVDFISISESHNEVVLTISDHLSWDEEYEHLLLLQEKINHYLSFIESGELLAVYPKSSGRHPVINIVGIIPLSPEARNFFEGVRSILTSNGIKLRFELFSES